MLALTLKYRDEQADVEFRIAIFNGMECTAGYVSRLSLSNGIFKVGKQDIVVLACSNSIRRLLASAGVLDEAPGLHVVGSHLAAIHESSIPLIAYYTRGVPNLVSHSGTTIFGNSNRRVLPINSDGTNAESSR